MVFQRIVEDEEGNTEGEYITFTSQYALLSDIHFLNSVIAGRSLLGSYLCSNKLYYPTVNS